MYHQSGRNQLEPQVLTDIYWHTNSAKWNLGVISNITLTLVYWFLYILLLLKEKWDVHTARHNSKVYSGKVVVALKAKELTTKVIMCYVSSLWPLEEATHSLLFSLTYRSSDLDKGKHLDRIIVLVVQAAVHIIHYTGLIQFQPIPGHIFIYLKLQI